MWQVYEVKVIALTRGGLTSGRESVVTTNCEKSAEVIVPAEAGKDRTVVVFETEEGGRRKECRKPIIRAGIVRIEWNSKVAMERRATVWWNRR